jgi:hypothetical protein
VRLPFSCVRKGLRYSIRKSFELSSLNSVICAAIRFELFGCNFCALGATSIIRLLSPARKSSLFFGAGGIGVVLLRQAIQRVKDVLNCLLPDFGFRAALSVTSGVSLFIDQMQTISQYGTPFHIAIFLLTCKLVGE